MDDTYQPPSTPISNGDGFFHDGNKFKLSTARQKHSSVRTPDTVRYSNTRTMHMLGRKHTISPVLLCRTVAKKLSMASSFGSIAINDRRRRMKVIERYLKQHNKSIVKLTVEDLRASLVDAQQIGHEFDPQIKGKKKSRCNTIFQHLSNVNRKFGLQHIILVLLLIAYALIGGAVFEAIERPNEMEDLNRLHQVLLQKIENTTEQVISIVLSTNETNRQETVERFLEDFYKEMLELEGRNFYSVFDKFDNQRLLWNFGSSLFYSIALFTTTGYGTISCATPWGKAITIIYATIGIPLILVTLNDLGRVLLLALEKLYNRIYRLLRPTRLCRKVDDDDSADHTFPLRIAIPLVIVYLLLCAAIVHLFDYTLRGEDEKALKFGDSFYFTFISMTTIGLGDVMPINIQYSPFMAAMFIFGLVLISVINSTVYVRMERNYFRAVEVMEALLEDFHDEEPVDEASHGHVVLRMMSDAIRIAAIILPNVDVRLRRADQHGTMPDSLRASINSRRSVLSGRRPHQERKSSGSLMTLGALGINLASTSHIRQTSDPYVSNVNEHVLRSRVLSRSDTDLTTIQHRDVNVPLHSQKSTFESRFYLDTVREVNELTESYEMSRMGHMGIPFSRQVSRSDTNLFTLFEVSPVTKEISSTTRTRFYVDKVHEAAININEIPELFEALPTEVRARRHSDTDLPVNRPRQFNFQRYRSLRSSRDVCAISGDL